MDPVTTNHEVIVIEDDTDNEFNPPRQQVHRLAVEISNKNIEISNRMQTIRSHRNQHNDAPDTPLNLLNEPDDGYEADFYRGAMINLIQEPWDQPVTRLQRRQITPATATSRQAQREVAMNLPRYTPARHPNHPLLAPNLPPANGDQIPLAHSPPPYSSSSPSDDDSEDSEDNAVNEWDVLSTVSSVSLMDVQQRNPPPAPVDFGIVLQQTLEIFPDVCPDYVRSIYDNRLASQDADRSLGELVIVQIAEDGRYPKIQQKPSKKRKTSQDGDESSDESAIAEYVDKGRERASDLELRQAKRILQLDFSFVPVRYIDEKLKELGNLFPAYNSIAEAVRSREDNSLSTFAPLKKRRVSMLRLDNLPGRLKREYEAVKKKVSKEDAARLKKRQEAEEDATLDKKAFDEGDTKECECCFSDAVIRKMIHCDGDEPHFFCYECLQRHVQAQLDLQKHNILCMAGCKAGFSRSSKLRCLTKDIFARLERLQQQSELREANVPGLEACPFCDFAAILPPIEEDKEFRCEHPDCKVVSCRLCKCRSHIPKTCEQAKKEHGIDERHIVEEEMTKALIRTCKKCKIAILKTEGCNKIVCSRCGAFICDVCGKDISRESYGHFGPGKCAQYDTGGATNRESKRVQEAEKAAKAKVRAENPNISEADLEIKFSEAVKEREKRFVKGGYDPAARIALMEGMVLNNADRHRENQLHALRQRLQTINRQFHGIQNNRAGAAQGAYDGFGQPVNNNGPDFHFNERDAGLNVAEAPLGFPRADGRLTEEFERRLTAVRTELNQARENAAPRDRAEVERRPGEPGNLARRREERLNANHLPTPDLNIQPFPERQPGPRNDLLFGTAIQNHGGLANQGNLPQHTLSQLYPPRAPLQRDDGRRRRHLHHHNHDEVRFW